MFAIICKVLVLGRHRSSPGERSTVRSWRLRLNSEEDLGVLDDGEVRDDVQLEVAEVMVKRRIRNLPASVTGRDWRLVL
jgi:hypothetical protein